MTNPEQRLRDALEQLIEKWTTRPSAPPLTKDYGIALRGCAAELRAALSAPPEEWTAPGTSRLTHAICERCNKPMAHDNDFYCAGHGEPAPPEEPTRCPTIGNPRTAAAIYALSEAERAGVNISPAIEAVSCVRCKKVAPLLSRICGSCADDLLMLEVSHG